MADPAPSVQVASTWSLTARDLLSNGHPWSWHALAVALGWLCLWLAVEVFVVVLAAAAALATGQASALARRTDSHALYSQRAALAQAAVVGLVTVSALVATQVTGGLLALAALGGALAATATVAWRARQHGVFPTGASLIALATIGGPLTYLLGAASLAALATTSVSATVVWLTAALMFVAGVAVAGDGASAGVLRGVLGGIGAGSVAFCVCALAIPPFTPSQVLPATIVATLTPSAGRLLLRSPTDAATPPVSGAQLTPLFSAAVLFAPAWLLLLL